MAYVLFISRVEKELSLVRAGLWAVQFVVFIILVSFNVLVFVSIAGYVSEGMGLSSFWAAYLIFFNAIFVILIGLLHYAIHPMAGQNNKTITH
jgi:hypothetical protein